MPKVKSHERTAVLVAFIGAGGAVLAALISGIADVISAWLQSGGSCPS